MHTNNLPYLKVAVIWAVIFTIFWNILLQKKLADCTPSLAWTVRDFMDGQEVGLQAGVVNFI